jgi:hypothetical protein
MTAAVIISVICPALFANADAMQIFIELAGNRTSSSYFGTDRTMAVALRACHMFSLAQRSMGAAGSISSMTEGKLSLSFSVGSNSGVDDLDQTGYGKQLKQLIDDNSCGMRVQGQM